MMMIKGTILVTLTFAILSIHCCAASILKNNNVYGRPTGLMTKEEFLDRIRPVQEYEWDDEKGEQVPVGEEKILNDNEVHSLLVLVRDPYTPFSFGKRPCDFLDIVTYLPHLPYIHCTASFFEKYNDTCKSAKDHKALVNYCNAAIKKHFQHCSEKGISHFFNDWMGQRKTVLPRWFRPSHEFDKFIEMSGTDASLPEETKIQNFLSSVLFTWHYDDYEEKCDGFIDLAKRDLAFFFFGKDVSKLDYSAIKEPEPEYDRLWKFCKGINDLEEENTRSKKKLIKKQRSRKLAS